MQRILASSRPQLDHAVVIVLYRHLRRDQNMQNARIPLYPLRQAFCALLVQSNLYAIGATTDAMLTMLRRNRSLPRSKDAQAVAYELKIGKTTREYLFSFLTRAARRALHTLYPPKSHLLHCTPTDSLKEDDEKGEQSEYVQGCCKGVFAPIEDEHIPQ